MENTEQAAPKYRCKPVVINTRHRTYHARQLELSSIAKQLDGLNGEIALPLYDEIMGDCE